MTPIRPDVEPSTAEFEVHLAENVSMTARDGTQLVADVYRPARDGTALAGPLPTLLQRTPYDKSEVELTNAEARWFAARGYVAVVQDCRGCFRSGGDVDFLIPEAEDGADTMTWLAQQSWYDGTVGTWGCS